MHLSHLLKKLSINNVIIGSNNTIGGDRNVVIGSENDINGYRNFIFSDNIDEIDSIEELLKKKPMKFTVITKNWIFHLLKRDNIRIDYKSVIYPNTITK